MKKLNVRNAGVIIISSDLRSSASSAEGARPRTWMARCISVGCFEAQRSFLGNRTFQSPLCSLEQFVSTRLDCVFTGHLPLKAENVVRTILTSAITNELSVYCILINILDTFTTDCAYPA